MEVNFKNKLLDFPSINLTELNATASYLKRIDIKYLMTEDKLKKILGDLKNNFQVLDINGTRIFSYDNIYMDTDDYFFYHQHQNKENSRTKIRTRLYKDSNLAFFEYKQKESGITKKFRYEFPHGEHGKMTKGKRRFFEGVRQSLYSIPSPEIIPTIKTKYNRLTLVDKSLGERLTIDFNIKIKYLRNKNSKEIELKNLVIIESKSMNEECISSKIMEKHSIEKAKSCSKYSLGIIYSGLTERWNTFKETMKRIKEIRLEIIKNKRREISIKKVKKVVKNNFKKTNLKKVEASI